MLDIRLEKRHPYLGEKKIVFANRRKMLKFLKLSCDVTITRYLDPNWLSLCIWSVTL